MKIIQCAQCGEKFHIDATPESDLEYSLISDQEYNNDLICMDCAIITIKEIMIEDVHCS